MPDDSGDYQPRGSVEFVESSILDTIVPLTTESSFEDLLSGSIEHLDEDGDSPLSSIAQRQSLFFDETVDVYVVLQTPYFDERTLRSYLSRLAITLEAQAVNASGRNEDSKPNHEVIFAGSVEESDDPLIIVQGADEDESLGSDGLILVVWKLSVFVSRPQRLRMQSPSIVFSAAASLKPAEQLQSGDRQLEYLPSQVPSGINLLEAFRSDATLSGVQPRLSALRVSRVVPTQMTRDLMRPLKNISRRSFKVYPVLNARIKYTRPSSNTAPSDPSMLASVEIEITPFASCEISLEDIKLSLSDGIVESLNGIHEGEASFRCFPRDDLALIYRLTPEDTDMPKANIRSVEVFISAKALLSDNCQPLISMKWKSNIDFTPPVNPGFGQPSPAIHRNHRPSQLSIGSSLDGVTAPTNSTNPDALISMELTTRHERASSIPDFGVTMTFTCITDTIIIGEPFLWEIFIVNRSDRSRKLSLTVVPKKRRAEARTNRPPSTGYGRKNQEIANALMDENVLHAMQRSATVESTDVVCLSTDARIGPLSPSACHTVQVQLMALSVGILTLEAVRIIDLATQEHVEIKDLPMIVSHGKVK